MSSDQLNELAGALAKAQAMLKPAVKDSMNPHFKNRYADLESVWDACREPLTKNGLSVTQLPIQTGDGRTVLRTMLIHVSGQYLTSELPLNPVKNDPQGLGSALSYMRRYALAAMVGVVQTDDDGNEASTPAEPARKPVAAVKPQAQAQAAKPAPKPVESVYRFPSGPHRGKSLSQLTVKEVDSYLSDLLKKVAESGKAIDEISPEARDAINALKLEQATRVAGSFEEFDDGGPAT
jgi:hypothetical protein